MAVMGLLTPSGAPGYEVRLTETEGWLIWRVGGRSSAPLYWNW